MQRWAHRYRLLRAIDRSLQENGLKMVFLLRYVQQQDDKEKREEAGGTTTHDVHENHKEKRQEAGGTTAHTTRAQKH